MGAINILNHCVHYICLEVNHATLEWSPALTTDQGSTPDTGQTIWVRFLVHLFLT